MALLTAAEARVYIPSLSGTGSDTLLDTLISRAGAALARYCGYPPASATASPTMESTSYTIDFTGQGGRDLDLGLYPVTAITSVYDDPDLDFTDAADLVASSDYAIQRGRVLRLTSTSTHGAWSTTPEAIRVAFTAGYSTIPADMKDIAGRAVRAAYDWLSTAGKLSMSQGGLSVQYPDEAFLTPHVELALAPHRLARSIIGGGL